MILFFLIKSNTRGQTNKETIRGQLKSLVLLYLTYDLGEKMKKSLRVPGHQGNHSDEFGLENLMTFIYFCCQTHPSDEKKTNNIQI